MEVPAKHFGFMYFLFLLINTFFLFLQAWCDIYFPRYLFSPTLTTIAKDKFESAFLLQAN